MVNLVAACSALLALTVAAREADEEHAYGHQKAEYFSSGFEGLLILVAAILIAVTAVPRLIHPAGLSDIGFGVGVSIVASFINLGVARQLSHAARAYDSIALAADSRHLFTDV